MINVNGYFDGFDPIKVIIIIFKINNHKVILLIKINLLVINLVLLIIGSKNQILIDKIIIINPVNLLLIDRKIE
jgi:hypothetical protein